MQNWHLEFEKTAPQAHYYFLISLGIDEKGIKRIRKGILK